MLKHNWLMSSEAKTNKGINPDPRKKIIGSCSILLLLCLGLLTPQGKNFTSKLFNEDSISQQSETKILPLVSKSANKREHSLKKLLEDRSKLSSLDKARVRYLLATDLLTQQKGKAALEYLADLETDYPLLTPYILFLKAKAYKQTGEFSQLKAIKQKLIDNYLEDRN